MLPVTRRVAIIVVALIALPLLLACGEAEDLGAGTGSGGGTAVSSPNAEVSTPTLDESNEATPTSISALPVVTAEPGDPGLAPTAPEESRQAIDEPEWLTLDEAQALVDFEIVVPKVIPEGLHLIGIGVNTLLDVENGEGEGDGTLVAYLGFAFDAEAQVPDYALAESLQPPIEFDYLEGSGVELHQLELVFGETVVTRTLYAASCFEFIALTWTDKDVHFAVVSSAPGNTDVALTASLAGAVIGVEPPDVASLATPEPVEPTPNLNGDYCDLTPQEARDLAPFPVYVPDETPAPFVLDQIDLVVQRWSESEGYSPDGTVVIEPTPEMHESIELSIRYSVDGATEGPSVTLSQRSVTDGMGAGSMVGPDDELIMIEGVEVRYYTFPGPLTPSESDDTATPSANDWLETTEYSWLIGETQFTAHVSMLPADSELLTDDVVHHFIASFIREAANP